MSIDEVYRELQARIPAKDGAAEPVEAAIVVLWRKVSGASAEVFMVKRAPGLSFLPGYWSFPGGQKDPGDPDFEACALRELLEETGISVSRDRLCYAGEWVTPALSRRRFATRYFFAEVDASVAPEVSVSEGELVEGIWCTAAQGLDDLRWGRKMIAPPTEGVLRAFQDGAIGAAERALAAAESACVHRRVWSLGAKVELIPLRTPTLPPATHTNAYLVGDKEMILVDPAPPSETEREVLASHIESRMAEGAVLREIWLTHHHGDHTGAAGYFSQRFSAPIFAHAKTAELLRGVLEIQEYLEDGEIRSLDAGLAAGEEGAELECIFTPGHAPGHLCFLERRTGALMAGDMVASVGTILIDPSEGNMIQYLDSLRLLRARKPNFLLPAHGSPVADPEHLIDGYIAHRLMREDKVVSALGREPQSLPELVPVVYSDTPAFLHDLAARSLESHLLKLAEEGRAEETEAGWIALSAQPSL